MWIYCTETVLKKRQFWTYVRYNVTQHVTRRLIHTVLITFRLNTRTNIFNVSNIVDGSSNNTDGLTPKFKWWEDGCRSKHHSLLCPPYLFTCLPTYHTHVIVTTTTKKMIKQTCHYLSFVSSSQLSTRRGRHRRYQRHRLIHLLIEIDGQTRAQRRCQRPDHSITINSSATLFRRTTYTEEYDAAEARCYANMEAGGCCNLCF